MTRPEDAIKRVLDPQFPLEPTVKKAITYLLRQVEELREAVEEMKSQCPGNSSSTSSESTKTKSEPSSPSPQPRARTAASHSRKGRTGS